MGIMNPRRIVPSGHEEEVDRGSAAASVFTAADEQSKRVRRGKTKNEFEHKYLGSSNNHLGLSSKCWNIKIKKIGVL